MASLGIGRQRLGPIAGLALLGLTPFGRGGIPRHHAREVVALPRDRERVARQRVLLDLGDVAVHTVGERQNRRDADDADRPGEGRHDGAALLGHEVVEGQGERREQTHRRAVRGALVGVGGGGRTCGLDLILRHGARVPGEAPVLDAHDARRVIFGELRVVRDHDHEPLARDLREQIHHLDARLGVEGARGLIGEYDLGIVHQRACDGDALHLTSRELRWLLIHMRAQAHALECGAGAALALGAVHARQRERELHVGQDRLVRDEVVALEDEAHAVIAVRVPLRIRIVAGRGSIHHDIARVGVVEAAQYVQERGLTGARWAQNRHELALPEGDGDAVQGALDQVPGLICLGDVANLDHAQPIHVMSYSLFVPTFDAFRRTC